MAYNGRIAMNPTSLHLFHPLVGRWFEEQMGAPTEIQELAWPRISAGEHVLVTAPTGCGKTMAAFLWSLDRFITHPQPGGRVLYISPLKALNNDIGRNLQRPLDELRALFASVGEYFPEITVDIRSGDTPQRERRRMASHPPHILITTPESLNVLLLSESGRRTLEGIRTVILDEIHAVLPNKRGTWLMSGLEQLAIEKGEFQRIALSATVNPLAVVADFVGGRYRLADPTPGWEKRPVRIVQSTMKKRLDLQVDLAEVETPAEDSAWWRLVDACRRRIAAARSTLIFANGRRVVEKVARLLHEAGEETVFPHHGSLSRELRAEVEKRFKNGEVKAIVATSSLELGIDIGSVEQVLLIQPPVSISAAMQRIGRSGHGVGETARGVFQPLYTQGLLESGVTAAAVAAGGVEPMLPVEEPLDVLSQVILARCCGRERSLDDLYRDIRCIWSYRDLDRAAFDRVIEMLAGRYADSRVHELLGMLQVDRLSGTARTPTAVVSLLYFSGGVIPDRGYYTLRQPGGAKIGELDEEFVWERSVGDTFPFGRQVWRIQRMTANDVEVVPVAQGYGLVPFWRAEELNRSAELSQRIGDFLEAIESNGFSDAFRTRLRSKYFYTETAIEHLQRFLERQRETTRLPLPHRHHIIGERIRSEDPARPDGALVLHTFWGGRVNRPLAMALETAWLKTIGTKLETFVANDAILFQSDRIMTATELLCLITPESVPALIRARLPESALFGARFRENAQRALLLTKPSFRRRQPLWLSRQRARRLFAAVSGHADFPVTEETRRECLDRELEIGRLIERLEEIRSGVILISETETTVPSPFSESVIWKRTNQYMYESDSLHTHSMRPASGDGILDVLHSPHLRPRFSSRLLDEFLAKRQRVLPGYAPDTPEDLLQWVRERVLIPAAEWQTLLREIGREREQPLDDFLVPIRSKLAEWPISSGEAPAVIARENLERIGRVLGPSGAPGATDEEERMKFILEWLYFYGPVSPECLGRTLGIDAERLDAVLEPLTESGKLVVDEFREEPQGKGQVEICLAENLEILLRLRRSRSRPRLQPSPIESLPSFLAFHQGLSLSTADAGSLPDRLEQLFGYPARASLWENEILPARIRPYQPEQLDQLLHDSGLTWFGCGRERIAFCLESDLDLAAPAAGGDGTDPDPLEKRLIDHLQKSRGRFTLADLVSLTGASSDRVTQALWVLVWRGMISNDQFQTLRQGIASGFKPDRAETPARSNARRRLSFSRWQSTRPFSGHWFSLSLPETESGDALAVQELVKDRARLLLRRYGVLFRELTALEFEPFRWSLLLPALRLLELSGEIVAGRFFEGISGMQFAFPEVVDRFSQAVTATGTYWLNAADPASACGLDLPLDLPPRFSATHLAYHDGTLALVSHKNGVDLDIRMQSDAPDLPAVLALFSHLLTRPVAPLSQVRVRSINGSPALASPYRPALEAYGFEPGYRELTLRKRYP